MYYKSGISGIGYVLIKNVSKETQKKFTRLASLCMKHSCIPDKWKVVQIYPIPKSEDWGYQINNIRPIALLETFRKCLTKIVTKRLSKIMVEKEILKGPNFAELPGCSTAEAIHLVEMIVEEAKENRKEL